MPNKKKCSWVFVCHKYCACHQSCMNPFSPLIQTFFFRGFTGLKAETANNDPLDKYKNIDLRLDDKDNFLQTISPDEGDLELGMAEPLTDAATREAKKDSMRVRMEMMMM